MPLTPKSQRLVPYWPSAMNLLAHTRTDTKLHMWHKARLGPSQARGQNYIHRRRVCVQNVRREINCADALASPCAPVDLAKHLSFMDFARHGVSSQAVHGPD